MTEANGMVSKDRFEVLKNEILDYETAKKSILTGIEDYERIKYRKKRILEHLNASERDYDDYRWQMKNRFTGTKGLDELIGLSGEEIHRVNDVAENYRFAVSPYYLSLIDPENPDCPVKKQSIPSIAELNNIGELDPMDEKGHAIHEIITRRYPDRLIIKVTNICGMFCRFCQRRRLIGEFDKLCCGKNTKAIDYIAENSEIRDVLITAETRLWFPMTCSTGCWESLEK